MRTFLMMAVVLILAACATDDCSIKTTKGACAGNAEFAKIFQEESHLTAPPPLKAQVQQMYARSFGNMYQEAIQIKNGMFRLDQSYRGGFIANVSDNEFKEIMASWKVSGINIDHQTVKIDQRNGVRFGRFPHDDKSCIFIKKFLGQQRELQGGLGYQATLYGHICSKPSYDQDTFISEITTALNQVKLK